MVEYKRTKDGVDTIDMICSNYSSSRRTKRWSMVIFFYHDKCCLQSKRICSLQQKTTAMTRLDFMKSLAMKLITPLMQRRLHNGHLSQDLQLSLKRILRTEDRPLQEENKVPEILDVKKTCNMCPPRLKRNQICLQMFCQTNLPGVFKKSVCKLHQEHPGQPADLINLVSLFCFYFIFIYIFYTFPNIYIQLI